MIQQVRNQNRPSLACLFLSLSLPCFQPQRRQLGWFGRIARCRGLARSSRPESESEGVRETELELRVTTELPGNTVSNDNERKGRRRRAARRSRKRGATAVAAARQSPSGREGWATKKPTPQTGGGRGVVGERGRAGKSTHRAAERRAGRRVASGGGDGGKGVRRLCCRESSLGRQRSSHLISRWRRRWRQRARRVGGRPTILYPLHAPPWLLRMETTFSLPYLAAAAAAWRDNFLLPSPGLPC